MGPWADELLGGHEPMGAWNEVILKVPSQPILIFFFGVFIVTATRTPGSQPMRLELLCSPTRCDCSQAGWQLLGANPFAMSSPLQDKKDFVVKRVKRLLKAGVVSALACMVKADSAILTDQSKELIARCLLGCWVLSGIELIAEPLSRPVGEVGYCCSRERCCVFAGCSSHYVMTPRTVGPLSLRVVER